MQRASAIFSYVACPAVQYFSTPPKQQDFRRCYWQRNMCFDFFYKFVWNISYSRKNWAWCHKCVSVFKYEPAVLVRYSWKWNFLDIFSKNAQTSNLI